MLHKKEEIISKIIVLIGVVFTVYGLLLCVMSNLNIGVLLVVVFGIITLCTGVFYKNIKELVKIPFFKICSIIFVVLLCAEFLLISFIAFYGVSDNADYTENAVIVLGAGIRGDIITMPLKMRLDKVIDYHRKNQEALIVVTGGQGFQETVTEASAMEKYLIKNGVDKNKILKEKNATSTFENMKFSKEILDNYFSHDYSVVVVTNNFHILRSTIVAKKTGFQKVSHIQAGYNGITLCRVL